MEITELLAKDGIIPSLASSNKKQLLQDLSSLAAERAGLSSRDIFDALLQRERLGSTGLGRGVAIPHVKFKDVKSIVCLFARLDTAIDYESNDKEPVDLVFVLIAPEHASGDHLKALARISRLVREPGTLERLRAAASIDEIRTVLKEQPASNAA